MFRLPHTNIFGGIAASDGQETDFVTSIRCTMRDTKFYLLVALHGHPAGKEIFPVGPLSRRNMVRSLRIDITCVHRLPPENIYTNFVWLLRPAFYADFPLGIRGTMRGISPGKYGMSTPSAYDMGGSFAP